MYLVNERYKILLSSSDEHEGDLFLSLDLNSNRKSLLKIIKPELYPANVIEYFKEQFITICTLRHPNLTEAYSFSVINTIDGEKINSRQYYFTYEYFKGKNVFEASAKMGQEGIADIIVQVCQALKFLHRRGFLYRNIDTKSIQVVQSGSDYIVKLGGIILPGDIEVTLWKGLRSRNQFRAPEVLKGGEFTRLSDLYSLGVLIFYLVTRENPNKNNFPVLFQEYRNRTARGSGPFNSGRLYGFLDIIARLTADNPSDRYHKICEVIKDVNSVMGTQYPCFHGEYFDRIINETSLVGRKDFLEKMDNFKDEIFNEGNCHKAVFLNGEYGIGKSRLLQEFIFQLEMDKIKTIAINAIENDTAIYGIIRQLLKQIMPFADTQALYKYGSELKKIMPDEKMIKNFKPSQALPGEREGTRLIYCAANFIIDALKDDPAVIVIDSAQWIDEFSWRFLDFLINSEREIPLMIIISCRAGEWEHKSIVKDYLKKWGERELIYEITLKGFNYQDTGEMIRNILGIRNTPMNFTGRLMNETRGNPLFIKDIITSLHAEKKLYIDENGNWSTDYDDDYSMLSLPSSIHEAILKKISILKEEQGRVLDIISVFYSPAPLEIVKAISEASSDEFSKIIDTLVSSKIIEQKIGDSGFSYDFHSIAVKNEVYNRIEKKNRRKMHQKCAVVLESMSEVENMINSDELIYQYIQAGEPEKALKYIIKSAELMMYLNINNQALEYLDRGIRISKELPQDENIMKILYMTGESYFKKGENEKALDSLIKALDIASKLNDTSFEIDCCIKMGNVYNRRNEQDKALEVYRKAAEISESHENTEKLLDVMCDICKTLALYKSDYNEALKIVDDALSQYGGGCYDLQFAKLYNLRGICLLGLDIPDKALFCFNNSIALYEKAGNLEDVSNPYNNIGIIYARCYQDLKSAMEYFKKSLEIEQKKGVTDQIVGRIENIGIVLADEANYKEALYYISRAEEIRLEIGAENYYFPLSLNLLSIFESTGDYIKAFQFLNKCVHILEKNPDQSWYVPGFYQKAALFYFEMGHFSEAVSYASDGMRVSNESNKYAYLGCRSIIILSKYYSGDSLDIEELESLLVLYRESGLVRNLRESLHIFAEALIDAGDKKRVLKLIDEIRNLAPKADNRRLNCEFLYLEGIYNGGIKGLKKLEEAVRTINPDDDIVVLWKIYNAIGDIYLSKNDRLNAQRYYLKSMDALYKIALKVPEQFLRSFLKTHNRNMPREKFLKVKFDTLRVQEKEIEAKIAAGLKESSDYMRSFFDLAELNEISSANNENCKHGAEEDLKNPFSAFKKVLSNLSSDYNNNLEMIMESACEITGAENCYITVAEGEDKKLYMYSKNTCRDFKFDYIIEYTKEKGNGILVTDIFGKNYGNANIIMPEGRKAIMCIPIQGTSASKIISSNTNWDIRGYIYLDTCSIQNRFNNDTLELSKTFADLAFLSIDNQSLKIVSSMDKLTGVYTRKYFDSAVEDLLKRPAPEKNRFSIIMLDIDRFKNFNDRYGHQKGDEVLSIVGDELLRNTRKGDICCRYGGEEFIIILPNTNIPDAEIIAERLRKSIEGTKLVSTGDTVTISLGIAAFPKHGKLKDELIRRADQALYCAKMSGRNKCCTWNSKIKESTTKSDILTGIVTGNVVQDQRNVLAILEMIDIANETARFEEKIYSALGRIMEVLDAEESILAVQSKGYKKMKIYARRKHQEGWAENIKFNRRIMNKAASNETGLCIIDWDNADPEDITADSPLWKSVIAVPVNSGSSSVVLYLASPVTNRKYGFNELNLAGTLAKVISIVFNEAS